MAGAQPDAKLYTIPGSHPAMAAQADARAQGHPLQARRPDAGDLARRAEGASASRRTPCRRWRSTAQGHRLARDRPRARPAPARAAALPGRRPSSESAVEEAERWGEEVLQPAIRRILWNALKRDRAPLRSYAEGAKLGIPIGLAVKTAAPIVAAASRINSADDEAVRADLAALPGWLKRIDDWIAEGVLGADQPNAADLQIAASLRLAMTLDDLRPAIEAPAGGRAGHACRPRLPGRGAAGPAACLAGAASRGGAGPRGA